MTLQPITKRKEVCTYLVRIYCPECSSIGFNANELTLSSEILLSHPIQYQYTCDCGFKTTLNKCYPTTEIEELT